MEHIEKDTVGRHQGVPWSNLAQTEYLNNEVLQWIVNHQGKYEYYIHRDDKIIMKERRTLAQRSDKYWETESSHRLSTDTGRNYWRMLRPRASFPWHLDMIFEHFLFWLASEECTNAMWWANALAWALMRIIKKGLESPQGWCPGTDKAALVQGRETSFKWGQCSLKLGQQKCTVIGDKQRVWESSRAQAVEISDSTRA